MSLCDDCQEKLCNKVIEMNCPYCHSLMVFLPGCDLDLSKDDKEYKNCSNCSEEVIFRISLRR